MMSSQLQAVRTRVAEAHVFEHDAVVESLELLRAGPVLDFLRLIEIAEDLFRRADSLLKDVVQIGQPLHRFIEKQQREQEAHEVLRPRACDS